MLSLQIWSQSLFISSSLGASFSCPSIVLHSCQAHTFDELTEDMNVSVRMQTSAGYKNEIKNMSCLRVGLEFDINKE